MRKKNANKENDEDFLVDTDDCNEKVKEEDEGEEED